MELLAALAVYYDCVYAAAWILFQRLQLLGAPLSIAMKSCSKAGRVFRMVVLEWIWLSSARNVGVALQLGRWAALSARWPGTASAGGCSFTTSLTN